MESCARASINPAPAAMPATTSQCLTRQNPSPHPEGIKWETRRGGFEKFAGRGLFAGDGALRKGACRDWRSFHDGTFGTPNINRPKFLDFPPRIKIGGCSDPRPQESERIGAHRSPLYFKSRKTNGLCYGSLPPKTLGARRALLVSAGLVFLGEPLWA
jgi:hypothetical protein